MICWTITVTLTLNTVIQSFHEVMYHQTKFGCKKISTSVDMVETIFLLYEIVSLTLMVAKQSFRKTLLGFTTKGSLLNRSEDTTWTNIQ